MPITIQEIIASDTISQFVDKTNFNFDQLLLNGGGPVGPTGPTGPTGPGGGRGFKGSTWYEDNATSSPGNNPNTVSPTSTPLDKDYYLQFNGQVWEYNGTAWVITTVDLQGPVGAAGGSGGFGLTIGSPLINQSNIIYNGPIGLNDGANITNEGVPSVLIGGVTSLTTALSGIPFTDAYKVPDTIIAGNSSYETSLLIHQKNSQARSIVFHGGDDTLLNDSFEQINPDLLSNISIGTDDKLMINVPKAPTSTSVQTDLRGIELVSTSRSQYFQAGADILFQSGVGSIAPLFVGQHSNFEINVGLGGSNGDGNVFKTITQGTIGTTLLEAGNSSNITLVTNQNTQTGRWQLQAGEIRMVSSTTKPIGLYAGGPLLLNTIQAGGANAGTGPITIESGSGGIIGTANNGSISLTQTNATSSSNIQIIQNSNNGTIDISSNSNTIIRGGSNIYPINTPSIVLDYTAAIPHTRIVGQRTTTYSLAQPPSNPIPFVGNFINPTGSLSTVKYILEQIGTETYTEMAAGSWYRQYNAGTNPTITVPGGTIGIVMGSEGLPTSPLTYGGPTDNSLQFSVRNQPGNATSTDEYISLGRGKLGLAVPLVHKRDHGLNAVQNTAPVQEQAPLAANYIQHGWDVALGAPSGFATGSTSGMPTTAQLNVPFITLGFGLGIPWAAVSVSNSNYNYLFNFPIGSYPGQQLILKIVHTATNYNSGAALPTVSWGNITIRIPTWRRKSANGTGQWSLWWPTSASPDPVAIITSNLNAADALVGKVKISTHTLLWDGGIIKQQSGGLNGASVYATELQMGWTIVSSVYGGAAQPELNFYDNTPVP